MSKLTPDEAIIYDRALKDAWLQDTRPEKQREIAQKALSDYRKRHARRKLNEVDGLVSASEKYRIIIDNTHFPEDAPILDTIEFCGQLEAENLASEAWNEKCAHLPNRGWRCRVIDRHGNVMLTIDGEDDEDEDFDDEDEDNDPMERENAKTYDAEADERTALSKDYRDLYVSFVSRDVGGGRARSYFISTEAFTPTGKRVEIYLGDRANAYYGTRMEKMDYDTPANRAKLDKIRQKVKAGEYTVRGW